jgi:hypothetical protein
MSKDAALEHRRSAGSDDLISQRRLWKVVAGYVVENGKWKLRKRTSWVVAGLNNAGPWGLQRAEAEPYLVTLAAFTVVGDLDGLVRELRLRGWFDSPPVPPQVLKADAQSLGR